MSRPRKRGPATTYVAVLVEELSDGTRRYVSRHTDHPHVKSLRPVIMECPHCGREVYWRMGEDERGRFWYLSEVSTEDEKAALSRLRVLSRRRETGDRHPSKR